MIITFGILFKGVGSRNKNKRLDVLSSVLVLISKIMFIENYGGVSIKKKFWKAIKDAIIIILIIFLVATVLDYMNLNISLNKYGDKLAKLELINIYKNNNLNGLLTIGFILAGLSFVYDMFLKKETKEVKRK